jgi:membrane fusion protein, heavy metal efflux system
MSVRVRDLSKWALVAVLLFSGCKSKDSDAGKSGQSAKTSGSDAAGSGADTSGKSEGKRSGGESDSTGSDAGESSDASTPVGTVKIDPANLSKAGIRVAPVEVRSMPRQLTVAGQVVMDEKHTDHIGVYADGQVERVLVLPGDNVRAGQTLALMHSHTVHETEGALVQAYAAVERQTSAVRFAEVNRDRYQHLLELQVASQEEAQRADQQLRQAQQDLTDAQANVHMEREHLSELLQVPPSTLTPGHLYDKELVPIRAVSAGSVIQREVTPGQVLNLGQEAFVVSNLATVWVTAAVNEKDLPRVHRGARAIVTTQGYGDTPFHGTVTMLGDQLDPQLRTVPVRIQVPNPGVKLRPGMFAKAVVDEPSTRTAVFVPDGALQDVNGLRVVFVATDSSTFAVRAVKLGSRAKGFVEVVEGLSPGDHIVVDGAFMVKGELLKGSVGEG